MARFASFFLALVALFSLTYGFKLRFSRDDGDKVVLASYGDATDSISVVTRNPGDVKVSAGLFSTGTVTSEVTQWGTTNYTIPLIFDRGVGVETYTVSVGGESITGKIIVAGFVILSDGKIVSGDNAEGINVGQEGRYGYDIAAVGIDGSPVDLSSTSVTYKEMSGPYFKEVDEYSSSITSSKYTLGLNKFRVGTGSFLAMFNAPSINYRGESFETVLKIRQSTVPGPPCVAFGGKIETTEGMVRVNMINLRSPPQSGNIDKVVLHIGDTSVEWDKELSSLGVPDQVAVFKTPVGGKAVITCDGGDAYIFGELEISGDPEAMKPEPTPTDELATSLIAKLPESDSLSTISASLSVVEADPSTLTKEEGQGLLDYFCRTIGSETCVITAITQGSGGSGAVLALEGQVAEDKASEAETTLNDKFESCEAQTSLGYECKNLLINNVGIKAAAGLPGVVVPTGLATWTIVLIAGIGAFALILVIVLGLWAVYRRSAEQSESDYSSSGPLGVPDPSDLLYEQSIVRDIYGRGDFPEGGPSQAVAEQRAREADLREEFPRPPSSSGLSRGSGTDDASSTYSV